MQLATCDEVERGKPHPDIYLRAAEKTATPDHRFVDPRDYEREANIS